MSTNYRFVKDISLKEVTNRIESIGLFISPKTSGAVLNSICITDGTNYLWCYGYDTDVEFIRYGANDVSDMLELLADTFNTKIISEHDDGFFEDEEVVDKAIKKGPPLTWDQLAKLYPGKAYIKPMDEVFRFFESQQFHYLYFYT